MDSELKFSCGTRRNIVGVFKSVSMYVTRRRIEIRNLFCEPEEAQFKNAPPVMRRNFFFLSFIIYLFIYFLIILIISFVIFWSFNFHVRV